MLRLRYFFTAFIFYFLCSSLNAQNTIKVSGKVVDSETKESLIGVNIYVKEIKNGTITSNDGFYQLNLKSGVYNLTISYIGYKSITKHITVKNDNPIILNIELEVDDKELEEVVVTGRKKDANISEAIMSSQTIRMVTIKKIPALMGEIDVVKAIQLLPGVQSASEGSSNFSVRGGSTDQNLVLLDNAIIYNASHMMGFFSVFNNDAINEATLIKGDIPAYYGGRLSSVLNVTTKDYNKDKITGSGGIGLISSRLMLDVPIIKEKTNLMVAGRRTYADLFLPLGGDDFKDTYLHFYDLNAKLTHRFNKKNRISLAGYLGHDNFGMNGIAGLGFGNKSMVFKWNHIFSNSTYSSLEVNGTSYSYDVEMDIAPYSMNIGAGMKDWNLKYDVSSKWNDNNTTKIGISGIFHRFNLGEMKNNSTSDEIRMFEDSILGQRKALEYGFYVSHEQNINRRLTLKYGVRLSIFQNVGDELLYKFDENYNKIDSIQYGKGEIFNTYINPEPRIGLLYKLDKASSLKASYSRTVQYAQIASNSTGGLPFDIWVPSNPNLKPQKCDQFALGYFHNFDDDKIEASVEVYYKNFQNVLDYKENPNFMGNPEIDGELRSGKGRAYGIEFLLRKNVGKITGWVSYTYSRSFRTIEEINFGKEYRSPYDRPHCFNLVLSYDWTKRFNISANWIFNSGQAVTFPYAKYTVDNVPYAIYSGSRNCSRYPAYHRLDISATLKTKEKKWKKWEGEWVFSLYNAYGHHNTWAILFSPSEDNKIITERMYLFTFVPSISYNFKF